MLLYHPANFDCYCRDKSGDKIMNIFHLKKHRHMLVNVNVFFFSIILSSLVTEVRLELEMVTCYLKKMTSNKIYQSQLFYCCYLEKEN